MEITRPIIHLNGTSPQMLLDGYRHAASAIQDAIDAVNKIEFHSRDYYPVDGLWAKALKEHSERLANLREAQNAMLMLAIHAQEHIKD